MTAAPASLDRRRLILWTASFVLALATHGGIAAALLLRPAPALEGEPSDAVLIDLPADTSSISSASEEPAGVQPSDAPPADADPDGNDVEESPPAPDSPPPELAETAPAAPPQDPFPPVQVPEAEVVLPSAEKPETVREAEVKPDEAKPEEPAKEDRPTVPSQAQEATTVAAGGGGKPSSAAIATWRSKVASRLARFKRYPAEAAARRQQGTATVRFTMDATGRVLSRSLTAPSGSAALDQESLAMILRAQPLPPPPPGMAAPISVDVPVRFSFR